MIVRSLALEGFRNYEALHVDFHPQVNLIYGDNAQGKTNLLEAIAYLSSARSHRARYDREMIGMDQTAADIRGIVESRGRTFTVEAQLARGRTRKLFSNGVRLKNAGELAGVLNTVLFCPEDLYLIREGAAALSLKLAQREIFQAETEEWPVLLLDDVLSELDSRRQAFILNRIRGGQVFITCCEEEKLEGLEGGKAFHVQGGSLI